MQINAAIVCRAATPKRPHRRLSFTLALVLAPNANFSRGPLRRIIVPVGTKNRSRSTQVVGCTTLAAVSCLALALRHGVPEVSAQQLSVRRYDVSDGLAHSYVGAIHQDKKGYLWFGTREGLSRFDGYRFFNYGTGDGLENPIINAIAEDRQGRLWVATNGSGVARLIDDPREISSPREAQAAVTSKPKFVNYRVGDSPASNRVNALVFDATNIFGAPRIRGSIALRRVNTAISNSSRS